MHLALTFFLLLLSLGTLAFPQYESLAGLSEEEVEIAAKSFGSRPGAQPAPLPRTDTTSKLVFDKDHPFKPLRKGDVRGPCPGLNTLASHGYLDRSGIVTPGDIINAVQDGFNMGYDLATFVTYGAFIVDGNHLTNLMSIGEKSRKTGKDAPPPAIIGGLNTHEVFEGDASTTRGDAFFGDNHSFNETLFQQLIAAANEHGNGAYNRASASVIRHQRVLDSQARNPEFDFTNPRITTAYAESVFPFAFFVSGQDKNLTQSLSIKDARSFFESHTFPGGFKRKEGALGLNELGLRIGELWSAFPTFPGKNEGAGNFVVDEKDPGLDKPKGICYIYHKQVGVQMPKLYPNPQGALRTAIKANIDSFYKGAFGNIPPGWCEQIFPYGK